MTGVVIVGAGHGGSQAAVSLRDEGYDGRVVLIDAEEALPYHRPPLSKTFLKSPAAEPQPLRASKVYEDRGIERIIVRAVSFEPHARRLALSDGRALAYDHLVLALGSRNRALPVLEAASNVFSLRSLGDAKALRAALADAENVLIVGGGFIGLEAASALRSMGYMVTVLEAAGRVLGRVVACETSAMIAASLEESGVSLKTDARIDAVERRGSRVTGVLAAGHQLACDLVLLAIGAEPDTETARASGVAVDGGIRLDASLSTGIPGLWAVGDCTRFPHWLTSADERIESVQNATDQARHVARSIVTGRHEAFRSVPWFWSDIGSQKLQIAGLSRTATRRIVHCGEGRLAVSHFDGDTLVAVETVNWPAQHMLARRHIQQLAAA